jgi:hypothetical protein
MVGLRGDFNHGAGSAEHEVTAEELRLETGLDLRIERFERSGAVERLEPSAR